MSLRGIYDGGGVRKQNGHYQSSSLRITPSGDGRLIERHLVYEYNEGDTYYYPYLFLQGEDFKHIDVPTGQSVRYRFRFKHDGSYQYSNVIDILGGYMWSAYLYNMFVGHEGDFFTDEFDENYVKVAWSISPDFYWPPGWKSGSSPQSNYQFMTGEAAFFLKSWLGDTELNYKDESILSQYGAGKLYLWRVETTFPNDMNSVGLGYLGISMTVRSGYIDPETGIGPRTRFQGTGTSGQAPLPQTYDDHILQGYFDVIITNESNANPHLIIAPVKLKQQEILSTLQEGETAFTNTQGNPTYLEVYEKEGTQL